MSISLPPSLLSDDIDLPQSVRTSLSSSLPGPENSDEEMSSFISLPPDVDMESASETEQCFVLDEDDDIQCELDEQSQFQQLLEEPAELSVAPSPSPVDSRRLVGRHDAAEFFSPARVVPAMVALGLCASLSCDLLTGWDFLEQGCIDLSLGLLDQLDINFLILSPPCTVFSELQRLWNFKRMSPEKVRAMWAHGMKLLTHAIACAQRQVNAGRFFVLEHPARASSWQTAEMKHLKNQPFVYEVVFDQCMTGLRSKVHRMPMRKRTRLLTNSVNVVRNFQNLCCDKSHAHQTIQGSEGGVRRSVWAQCYPPPLVERLAQSALQVSKDSL